VHAACERFGPSTFFFVGFLPLVRRFTDFARFVARVVSRRCGDLELALLFIATAHSNSTDIEQTHYDTEY